MIDGYEGKADDVVLFEELPTGCGRRFGVATLHVPGTLNALSLDMVRALGSALQRWEEDPAIVGVVLKAAGDKAFCAGGDMRALYQSMRGADATPSEYARRFFAEEYTLDYLVHTYRKPLLCWGHGIVMGGGVGLMAGASHRVVTSQSRLAMPEVSIGLYPDVGGSWLLRRMPGRIGLFLALTAASLNATDALFCGLADFHVEAEDLATVLTALGTTTFGASAAESHAALSRLLGAHAAVRRPESNARRCFDVVNELMAGEDLLAIAARLRALRSDDPWLTTSVATFETGSPSSAALSWALWRRVPRMSLAEVFRLEYDVSLGCCAHADLREGIRALLVDKDRKPRWRPATLEEVTPALVADHFRSRATGAHPLASMDEDRAGD